MCLKYVFVMTSWCSVHVLSRGSPLELHLPVPKFLITLFQLLQSLPTRVLKSPSKTKFSDSEILPSVTLSWAWSWLIFSILLVIMGAYIDIKVQYIFWVSGNWGVIILSFTGFESSESLEIRQFFTAIATKCSWASPSGFLVQKIVWPASLIEHRTIIRKPKFPQSSYINVILV